MFEQTRNLKEYGSVMAEYPRKPFTRCYWLNPGRILAGELPTSPDPVKAVEKLQGLLDAGIRTIISLQEEHEMSYFFNLSRAKRREDPAFNSFPDYSQFIRKIAERQKLKIDCLRYPIRDMGIPDRSLMKVILETIDTSVNDNRPVYFHCYAGLGRTGMVAGCWLSDQEAFHRQDPLKRLDQIRHEQGMSEYGQSPQTREQMKFVMQWNRK